MKPRVYDEYLMLARITAPSYRIDKLNDDEPIPVITAIDDRFYPQQWDAKPELFSDVAGDNIVNELPDGLDRRKNCGFAAYIKHQGEGKPSMIVGVDAIPNRVYRRSVLPSASKDFTTLIFSWRPSGLVDVTQRPPLVKFETQALLIKTINDAYLLKKKPITAGMRLSTGKKDLGTVVRVSDSEIEVRPMIKATGGKPVYTSSEDE